MRKACFLIVWGLTLVAAVFAGEQVWIILFALETVALLALLAQAQLSWSGLKVGFFHKTEMIGSLGQKHLLVGIRKQTKIPLPRAAMKIRMGYRQEKRRQAAKVYCGVDRNGDMEYGFSAPYCGVVKVDMQKFWISDCLGIFFAGRKISDSLHLFVMPDSRKLNIKTGSEEQAEVADLRLDLDGLMETNQLELNNFYQVLSALTLGLLQHAKEVRVAWRDEEKGNSCCMAVRNEAQCRLMLQALYLVGLPETVEIKKQPELMAEPDGGGEQHSLNMRLEWVYNGKLICRFDEETDHIKSDISRLTFEL